MITPLPEEYLSSLDKKDPNGKLKPTPLRTTHSFLFGNTKDSTNRQWAAYLAIREKSSWDYSIPLSEVRKYATISSNYYRSLIIN